MNERSLPSTYLPRCHPYTLAFCMGEKEVPIQNIWRTVTEISVTVDVCSGNVKYYIPSLGVNQIGSTNFSRVLRTAYFCVLAYCVLRTVTFTQTPVQVRRKITFSAVTQNSSVRPYRFFKRTRAVLIYGRPASYRRIVCLVFAHGVQT